MEAARPAGAGRVIEALSRGLPADRIVVDPDVLAAISHDDAEWAPVGRAVAAVRARSEAEVQHVVRTCAELAAPVVSRGARPAGAVQPRQGITERSRQLNA